MWGYWVRWGDVKGLNLQQYRVNVVGALAEGGDAKASTMFVVRDPGNRFTLRGIANWLGIEEYVPNEAITDAEGFLISEN